VDFDGGADGLSRQLVELGAGFGQEARHPQSSAPNPGGLRRHPRDNQHLVVGDGGRGVKSFGRNMGPRPNGERRALLLRARGWTERNGEANA
jgi:hypothetical protein